MPPKKDPEEELQDQLRKHPGLRPLRTFCETCQQDFGTNRSLVQHAKEAH
jgi:hypothetical protein